MSCFNTRWSDEQRKEFETTCTQTESFHAIVKFKGFDNNEFDSIWVKQFKDSICLDSFRVFVPPAKSTYDRGRKERSVQIERPLQVQCTYHFVIPGHKPYELADMKMIMWAQYTQFSEGWGCVMGDYTLDGMHYTHDASPTLIKRDSTARN